MSAYTEYLASTTSAQAQMDFQERMSNTAHQREVADLKAAGLNPVLSAGGSGASTPSGAEGDYSAILPTLLSTVNNTAKALGKGVKNLTEASLISAISSNSANSGKDGYVKIGSIEDELRKEILKFHKDNKKPNETLDEYIRRKDKEFQNSDNHKVLKWLVNTVHAFNDSTKVGRWYNKNIEDPFHMFVARKLHKKGYEKEYNIAPDAKTLNKRRRQSKIKSFWNNSPKNAQMAYKYR